MAELTVSLRAIRATAAAWDRSRRQTKRLPQLKTVSSEDSPTEERDNKEHINEDRLSAPSHGER